MNTINLKLSVEQAEALLALLNCTASAKVDGRSYYIHCYQESAALCELPAEKLEEISGNLYGRLTMALDKAKATEIEA